MTSGRPRVWQMITEAVEAGARSNRQARDWILAKYPETNQSTIYSMINYCTVNSPSRIHGPENQRVRTERSYLDIVYRTGPGTFEPYDPARHGLWLIRKADNGSFEIFQAEEGDGSAVAQTPVNLVPDPVDQPSAVPSTFAAEAHLRDYLASNLQVIEEGLTPYADEYGNGHVEFRTDVGPIDILGVDRDGGLLVVELKVDRTSDAVAGQILRYVNWVRRHLAEGRPVRGMIIGKSISKTLLYSIDSDPSITAQEYDLHVTLKPPTTVI